MKKLLIILLVFGLASAASAAVSEDFEAKTLGNLVGQGGGTGFTNNWNQEFNNGGSQWQVVSETGNQFARLPGSNTEEPAHRSFTAQQCDNFQINFRLRFSDSIDAWGTGTPSQLQMYDTSAGNDPIHIKIDPGAGNVFRISNLAKLNLATVHNETTAGTYGGGAAADYYKDPVGNWVNVQLDVVGGVIQLYWETNGGAMVATGDTSNLDGGATTANVVDKWMILGKQQVGQYIDFDDMSITPEPATILMLGLGGLALIRKKR